MRRLPALLIALATPVTATAESEPSTHDGFFLGLQIGPGYLASNLEGDKVRGGAVGISIDIGGVVSENLALYAKLSGASIPGPTVEDDGGTTQTDVDDVVWTHSSVGPGVCYYFPSNVFVRGAITFSQLTLELGTERFESQMGLGAHAAVGWEAWVSDEWGIGVAAELMFSTIGGERDAKAETTGGSVYFSATYN